MKPAYEKISSTIQHSFLLRKIDVQQRASLKGAWHFHPEFEICLTYKSKGKRFVGNNISDYSEGDLVLIGKNIPHCWITPSQCSQYVVQWKEDFLGHHFLERPETQSLKQLFHRAQRGIEFLGKTRVKGRKKIFSLVKQEGFQKTLSLLDILNFLAESKEYRFLVTEGYAPTGTLNDHERVKIIYDYIFHNFQKEISIETAANLLNMTKSSFCKFIKKRTKKTFSQIVNEIRIGHACKLLTDEKMNISEICYTCGYNDISYFIRRFKELMKITPKEFRARYKGDPEGFLIK